MRYAICFSNRPLEKLAVKRKKNMKKPLNHETMGTVYLTTNENKK
jgi:hypothetical protein